MDGQDDADQQDAQRPTARLVTWGCADKVADHLQAAAKLAVRSQEVDLLVKTPMHTREIPPLLRLPADLVVFDGHGRISPLRVGTLRLDPAVIRDDQGRGITAPAFVLGACGGAVGAFTTALQTCLDSPTAFLGCDRRAEYEHAELVFPHVVDLLAQLGHSPLPSDFHAGLSALLLQLGDTAPGWTTKLLDPLPTGRNPRSHRVHNRRSRP
jgi:hypothetical protein